MSAATLVSKERLAGLVLDEDDGQPILLQVFNDLIPVAGEGGFQTQGSGELHQAVVIGTAAQIVAFVCVPLHDTLAGMLLGSQKRVHRHSHGDACAAGGLDGSPLGAVIVPEFAGILILIQRVDPGLPALLSAVRGLIAAQGEAIELLHGPGACNAGNGDSHSALVGLHCGLGSAAEDTVRAIGIIALAGQVALEGDHGVLDGSHGVLTGRAVHTETVIPLIRPDGLCGFAAISAVCRAVQISKTDQRPLEILDLGAGAALSQSRNLHSGGSPVDGCPGGRVSLTGFGEAVVRLIGLECLFRLAAEASVCAAGSIARQLQLHLEPDNGAAQGTLGGLSGTSIGGQAEIALKFLYGGLGFGAVAAVGGAIEIAHADQVLLELLDIAAPTALLHGSGIDLHLGQQTQHRQQCKNQGKKPSFSHFLPPHSDRWS